MWRLGVARVARNRAMSVLSADVGGSQTLLQIGVSEGVDDLLDLTLHETVQIVEGEFDPVIGHPVLGVIVGADLFRTITAADLALALRGVLLRLFALLFLQLA